MLTVFPVPAFTDNYIWVLVDDVRQQAIVVDPGDGIPVLAFLHQKKLTLKAILITHKHADHTGGVSTLLKKFPDVPVFSHRTDNVLQTTHFVSDGDHVEINDYVFQVIHIPGHTLGHVAYYFKPFLFSGDTLFTNGCGRVFEGTAEQMLASLKKLMALPNDTQVYCGHEYTLANIEFSLQVEPNNAELQKRFEETKACRLKGKPTVPSLMALEKATNPFLRCDDVNVVKCVSVHSAKKLNSETETFAELRQWKNHF